MLLSSRRPVVLLGVLPAALVLACAGCNKEANIAEHRLRAAVRQYNLALPRAYAEQRVDPLFGTATQRELSRVGVLILTLRKAGKRLESRQDSVKVEKVKLIDKKRGEVVTRERWSYRRRAPRATKRLPPMRRTRYRVRYRLVKRKGRWLVDKLDNLEQHVIGKRRGR